MEGFGKEDDCWVQRTLQRRRVGHWDRANNRKMSLSKDSTDRKSKSRRY